MYDELYDVISMVSISIDVEAAKADSTNMIQISLEHHCKEGER